MQHLSKLRTLDPRQITRSRNPRHSPQSILVFIRLQLNPPNSPLCAISINAWHQRSDIAHLEGVRLREFCKGICTLAEENVALPALQVFRQPGQLSFCRAQPGVETSLLGYELLLQGGQSRFHAVTVALHALYNAQQFCESAAEAI